MRDGNVAPFSSKPYLQTRAIRHVCTRVYVCSSVPLVITGSVAALTTQIATLIFSLHITTITAPPTTTKLVKCSGGGVAVHDSVHDWASGTGDTIILHPRQFPGDLRQRGGAREKSVSGTRKTAPCLNQANSGHYNPLRRIAPTVPSIAPIHNLSPGWRASCQCSGLILHYDGVQSPN